MIGVKSSGYLIIVVWYSIIMGIPIQDVRYDGELAYSISNLGFVSVVRNKDFSFPYKSGKNRNSLIYVEKGSLRYHFMDSSTEMTVGNNEMIYIPKEYPYIVTYLHDGTKIKILIFDICTNSPFPLFLSPFVYRNAGIKMTFDSLYDKRIFSTAYLASKIYELFDYMERSRDSIPEKYVKLAPALKEIEEKYSENHKISYYSGICYLSESHFRKLFREYTGKSIIEYRNNIRLLEARKMLDSGEFTVQETAYHVGFNNLSYFYELLRSNVH